MTNEVKNKLKQLPKSPGVYFHKDKKGVIIYVGKAAVLQNRVRQYFQKSRYRDPKTEALVSEIADIEWMMVDSEIEALFLEAEMIKRYMPRYNILLRDDKSMSYIRIDYNSNYPTVTTTRRPLDDKASYFGPYFSTSAVRQALRLLRRVFPYSTKRVPGQKRVTLHYHIGLDPGLEEGKTTLADYRKNLRKLIAVIEGRRKNIVFELERDMQKASRAHEFEQAAKLRNQIRWLKELDRQVVFGDKEFMDISKDHALNELVNLLSIDKYPRRIEGYDVSHMQGSDVVASMVVFSNGVSDKAEYRKFKTRIDQNNDFYNMHETIKRRFSTKNTKSWGLPDLVLIDGGKGQLEAAIKARDEAGFSHIPFIGLAKRQEQIIVHNQKSKITLNKLTIKKLNGYREESKDFTTINIPHSTHLIKLLQRIRDESHRFAITYHSTLKTRRVHGSVLDDISGIGPATRRRLLRVFSSVSVISKASELELAEVVGKSKARNIYKYFEVKQE